MQPEVHKCGQCGLEFASEDQYLDHKCEASGFTPREPENLGEDFAAISEAALARGAAQQAENQEE